MKLMMSACSPIVMTMTAMKVVLCSSPEKKSYSSAMRREQISLNTWQRRKCVVKYESCLGGMD